MPTEKGLEDQLAGDPSRVNSDLLVIGRQVRTDFGGVIDLLCIDKNGCTVVIELKKGRTPRDVTAQTLDYASWVKDLSRGRLTEIAGNYLSSRTDSRGSLATAFRKKFGKKLPDRLNESHRSIIVVGIVDVSKRAVDPSTERIVKYLADLSVPLSYQRIQYHDSQPEEEDVVETIVRNYGEIQPGVGSILKGYKKIGELLSMADANGVGGLYRQVKNGVRGILSAQAYSRTVGYRAKRAVKDGGGVRTVMFIRAHPGDGGGLNFTLHATRFRAILGIQFRELMKCLPRGTRDSDVSSWVGASKEEKRRGRGLEGEFRSSEDVAKFVDLLRNRT